MALSSMKKETIKLFLTVVLLVAAVAGTTLWLVTNASLWTRAVALPFA